MSIAERHLILGISFWPTGATSSGWRARSAFNGGVFDRDLLRETAQTAERGVFDYFFWGNSESSVPSEPGGVIRRIFQLNGFTAASYLAGQTSRVGLIATVNTSYSHPYVVAQLANNADHLSGGRFGLNLVAGAADRSAAANFGSHGLDPRSEEKYRRAEEFIEVLAALQDSWGDDWFLDDREGGRLFDPAQARQIDFTGQHFQVQGPLNAPRSPQGRVPILHAGTSEDSFEYGARYADARFSPFTSVPWNVGYREEQRKRAARHGRDPDRYSIVVGTIFFPGDTNSEAVRLFNEVERAVVEEFAPDAVARALDVDAATIRRDAVVIDRVELASLPVDSFARGLIENAIDAHGSDQITFLDLFRYLVNRKNFPVVVGDSLKIADWIEDGYRGGAFDGVKFFPPYIRGPFNHFVDFVVPELQRRGIARRKYDSDTLRGHFGLSRPTVAAS